MNGVVLTINAGSSSVKAAAFRAANGILQEKAFIRGEIAGLGGAPALTVQTADGPAASGPLNVDKTVDHAAAISALLDDLAPKLAGDTIAVGHRVVHGGRAYSAPLQLTPKIIATLERLTPLAPGHQPHNLAGIAAVRRRWPDIRQVACFDTAFHRTQPPEAERFALPRALTVDAGIIRYGFHGLSYEYVASAFPKVAERQARRIIVAHLGAGASMCALFNGKSIATSMGFTALDGLPMATRCGDIDPGVLLYLLNEKNMNPADLADLLYERSGLLGISASSGDMRVLEQSDDENAQEAIDYFVYRCVREIGALAACLGGVDALVFTAGIGENSPTIRKRILDGAAWLGFETDGAANQAQGPRITSSGSKKSAWVIPTNEELVIARRTLALAAT